MTLARTFCIALVGVAGEVVEIEADISDGIPGLSFTGLADTSVLESRDRVRAAMVNSGLKWPNRKITLALLPADVRKVGSRFDLALAMAVLAAAGEVGAGAVADAVWLAELGLDGRLRPVRGVLPAVMAARRAGFRRAVVAPANLAEAVLVEGMDVRAAHDLRTIVGWLRGETPELLTAQACPDVVADDDSLDLADVCGQDTARRALEVAAAGGHHLYLVGAPGAGKTMLAERLPALLPSLDDAEALEVTAVHSVAGALPSVGALIRRPPLQSPHHTASMTALVGGGSHLARPGAISLAHHGVLFLDEAPEFQPRALDALRQPMESGSVVLHRGGGAVTYPARFQLVLAANPCPCGSRAGECTCAPMSRRRYQQRLSGPLLDRVDLRIYVDPVPHADLFDAVRAPESSRVVAARVGAARTTAAQRWQGQPWRLNAEVPGGVLRSGPWALPAKARRQAHDFLEKGRISARGFDRVLRLAWTVADLAGHTVPQAEDVNEALVYRTGRAEAFAA